MTIIYVDFFFGET